jgi:hypothetical protein
MDLRIDSPTSRQQMSRTLPILLALVLVSALGSPVRGYAQELHVLEFGPYVGYFDFDRLSQMDDGFMAGVRVGVRGTPWLNFEMEFDEVYTSRHISGNRARQITLAGHLRVEPWQRNIAPTFLAGAALVAYDDEDDPDAYGDAYDLGVGVRWAARADWCVRAEWMLRGQSYRLYEASANDGALVTSDDGPKTLWSRTLRVGVAYVF